MKDMLKQIPEPLKRQILFRLCVGLAVLLISILLLFSSVELFSILSGLAITIFFAVSSFSLLLRAVIGDYVVIMGECRSVALTILKKRTKMITILTMDNQTLQVQIRQRLKKIKTGSIITLYVASNTPVYERNGAHLLYSYLAIDMKHGANDTAAVS